MKVYIMFCMHILKPCNITIDIYFLFIHLVSSYLFSVILRIKLRALHARQSFTTELHLQQPISKFYVFSIKFLFMNDRVAWFKVPFIKHAALWLKNVALLFQSGVRGKLPEF